MHCDDRSHTHEGLPEELVLLMEAFMFVIGAGWGAVTPQQEELIMKTFDALYTHVDDAQFESLLDSRAAGESWGCMPAFACDTNNILTLALVMNLSERALEAQEIVESFLALKLVITDVDAGGTYVMDTVTGEVGKLGKDCQ